MTLHILEWSALGAFGFGKEAFADALAGRTHPPVSWRELKGDRGHPFPYLKADLSRLKDDLPPRATRRMDVFGRIAAMLAADLLRGMPEDERRDLGLIVSTGFGSFSTNMEFLDSVIAQGAAGASPMLFSSTVHNSAQAAVTILFGLQGPAVTLSAFDSSLSGAFLLADAWLAAGRVEKVLVLASDDLPALEAYHRLRSTGIPDATKPEGLPAEGGTAFLIGRSGPLSLELEKEAGAGPIFGTSGPGVRCHARVYGRIACAPGFELAAAAAALEGVWNPGNMDLDGGVDVELAPAGGVPHRRRLRRA